MDKVLIAIVELITALLSDSQSPLYFVDATTTPHGVRRVFFGDPQQIENDSFPAVIVRPVSSNLPKEGTRTDQREHTVEVLIVENYRNYVSDNPSVPNKVFAVEKMMEMMESSNTSQQISGKTIIGKILANPRLPYTSGGTQYAAVMSRLSSIDYVFNTSRGFPTFEVIANFRITTRGDRSIS